jgi:hypothetical protein
MAPFRSAMRPQRVVVPRQHPDARQVARVEVLIAAIRVDRFNRFFAEPLRGRRHGRREA